jgi:hypothetical protein
MAQQADHPVPFRESEVAQEALKRMVVQMRANEAPKHAEVQIEADDAPKHLEAQLEALNEIIRDSEATANRYRRFRRVLHFGVGLILVAIVIWSWRVVMRI